MASAASRLAIGTAAASCRLVVGKAVVRRLCRGTTAARPRVFGATAAAVDSECVLSSLVADDVLTYEPDVAADDVDESLSLPLVCEWLNVVDAVVLLASVSRWYDVSESGVFDLAARSIE